MKKKSLLVNLYLLCFLVIFQICHAQTIQNDQYLEGYIRAVLDEVLHAGEVQVQVDNGVVHIINLPEGEPGDRILERLNDLEGVQRVVPVNEFSDETEEADIEQEIAPLAVEQPNYKGWFPEGELFTPLLFDPRASRFFGSARLMEGEPDVIGAVGFGEVFGIYRWNDVFGPEHDLQLNLEGGVFGYFDMDGGMEFQNVDFQVGFPLVYRYKNFSTRFRLLHRSAHLGDEYLRDNPNIIIEDRLLDHQTDNNLVDLIASYEWDWLRLYGGGLYRFDVEPERDPWDILYGIEFTPWSDQAIYPIAGIHFRNQEEFGWATDQRYVVGAAFQNWPFRNRMTWILLEYYNGKNLAWPFWREGSEYYGIGMYFDF